MIPLEDDMRPQEPVYENMNLINNKPVKAFLYQDHEAHIAVHSAAVQDPKIAEMVGQSPQAQSIMGAMTAHIGEHLAFAYRKQIEDQAGVPYPPPDAEMDEETELHVSRLAAKAAQQLLGVNKAEEAAKKAEQAANDPIVQMQQKELEIKEAAEKTKQHKVQLDAAAKKDELASRERKILLDAAARKDELASRERVEGMKLGQVIASDKQDKQAKGMELGIEVARGAREEYEAKQAGEENKEIPDE